MGFLNPHSGSFLRSNSGSQRVFPCVLPVVTATWLGFSCGLVNTFQNGNQVYKEQHFLVSLN